MSNSLIALSSETHSQLRFSPKADFSFAKKTHICPLLHSELSLAAQYYPVVFPSGKGVITPQVMLSVEPGTNPSVAENGSWQGGYLPLHFRRYPFYLGREADADQGIILFDKTATQLSEKEGRPLYQQEENTYVASPVLEDIKKNLVLFDQEYQKTRALCSLLQNAKVLKEGKLSLRINGQEQTVRGFAAVDWDAVTKLDDQTLANWTRIGLIQLIHIHLQSIKDHFKQDHTSTAS